MAANKSSFQTCRSAPRAGQIAEHRARIHEPAITARHTCARVSIQRTRLPAHAPSPRYTKQQPQHAQHGKFWDTAHSPHCAKQQPQHGVFRKKVPRPGSTASRSSCRLAATSSGVPGGSSGGTDTVCASRLGSSLFSLSGRMCHVHCSIAIPLCSGSSTTCMLCLFSVQCKRPMGKCRAASGFTCCKRPAVGCTWYMIQCVGGAQGCWTG